MRAMRGMVALGALLGLVIGLAAGPAEASAEAPAAEARAVYPGAGHPAADLEDHSGYNTEYFFALTRSVAYSTLATPVKPLAFLVTFPLDVALLPIAFIGGFFG